jgi:hypothetical protein
MQCRFDNDTSLYIPEKEVARKRFSSTRAGFSPPEGRITGAGMFLHRQLR